MSHITIECPDCKIEHTHAWKYGSAITGQMVCGCSTVIAYTVQLVARGTARDPNREEGEATHG